MSEKTPPEDPFLRGCCLFGKVDVIEDVVLAEAVVARAPGAIAELQIREVGIGTSADGTLMAVAPLGLFLLLLADGGLKVYGLLRALVPGEEADIGQYIPNAVPEEHGIHQPHRYQAGQQGGKQELYRIGVHTDDVVEGQEHIQDSQPLGLDGQYEIQADQGIGIKGGKGQEKNVVEVAVGHHRPGRPQPAQKGKCHCQHNTGKIKQCELGAAPVLFNGGTDEVVEKQPHYHPDDPVILGNENPGQKAPDLTAENGLGIKGQDGGSGILGKGVQKKDRCGDDDHIAHQTGDAEPGVVEAKAVDGVREFPQN